MYEKITDRVILSDSVPCAVKALELCARLEQECHTINEFYERRCIEARKQLHVKKIGLSFK
jgi:hypothetical protein